MATTIAAKPTAKTSASAAAPKGLTKGDTIKKPAPDGDRDPSEVISKKVVIPKDAGDTKVQPKEGIKPARRLVRTGVGTIKSATPSAKLDKITPEQSGRFVELSKLVRSGLKKMSKLSLEVADALREIRDQHLYRGEYKNFKAYCAAELGIQKAYAYDLAKAGAVHRDLQSAMADQSALPTNERQIRPLTKLTGSAQRVKAWKKARELAKDGKVTEALVRKAVKELQPPKAETQPAPPDTTWRDQLLTVFTEKGYEATFEQPIKWSSDAVALHSPSVGYYMKPVETLDITEAACVVALGEKKIPCLIMVNATANSPDGIIFSTGEQPQIEKESFPVVFHIIAKALDAVLEINGTFYKAGELDESFRTTWAPVSYLDLELPKPGEGSSAEPRAAQ